VALLRPLAMSALMPQLGETSGRVVAPYRL
jgi:hypothetical protein